MTSRLVKWAVIVAVSAAVLGATYRAGEHYAARDWLPWFQAQKGQLVRVAELDHVELHDSTLRRLRLTSDRGLAVTIQVREPRADGRPHPALLTLGGVKSGGRVSEQLPSTGRFVVVSIDYPYEGKRRDLSVWEAFTTWPAMRRGLLDTVPATMMAVDYLHTRKDIDRQRIILAGGSLGALIAPAAAAAEPRIAALAVLFGAGALEPLIAANLELPAPVEKPVAWVANLVVSPLEPLKYIGRVAPRPTLLINGTGDSRMPAALGRRLQAQAGEPRTTLWFDIGHASIRSAEFAQLVIDAFAVWLVENGLASDREARMLRVRDDRLRQPEAEN